MAGFEEGLEDMLKEAKSIYAKIVGELEKQHKGKIVAIELCSGNFFIGNSVDEAYARGSKAYPDKTFVYMKIGKGAVNKAYSI